MSVLASLREQERLLVRELESKARAKEGLLRKQEKISRELDSVRKELDALDAEHKRLAEKMGARSQKIDALRDSLKAYRVSARRDERALLVKEYEGLLAEVSGMDFGLSPRIFDSFRALRNMESVKFGNMRRKVKEKYDAERSALRSRLEDGVSAYIRAECGLHKAFLYLNYMRKYDAFFEEDTFTAYFFKDLVDNFTYHFLSGKETNRLDKPEWMFKFLYEKYEECSRFFEAFAKPLAGLLRRSEEVIGIKARELGSCGSGQKRSLIWHFADEFVVFSGSVSERHGHVLNGAEVYGVLAEVERRHVEDALVKVYSMEYSRWFKEYRSLVGESLYFYRRYRCLDHRALDVFVSLIDRVVESCSIFIDQMRFISREEIRALCHFYSEIEALKGFVNEEEADLLLHCSGEAEVNMFQQASARMVRFNQHNLNLLKLLAENDAAKLLRNIRNFSYTQESNLVSFAIDLTQMLQSYEGCTSYSALQSHVRRTVDRFFVDQVILRHKLSSEHYLRFIGFFGRVKSVFGSAESWETSACIKCIECVSSGEKFDGDSALFEAISELYNE